jgi:hypothetical protein
VELISVFFPVHLYQCIKYAVWEICNPAIMFSFMPWLKGVQCQCFMKHISDSIHLVLSFLSVGCAVIIIKLSWCLMNSYKEWCSVLMCTVSILLPLLLYSQICEHNESFMTTNLSSFYNLFSNTIRLLGHFNCSFSLFYLGAIYTYTLYLIFPLYLLWELR